ncbi:hypothetical protein ACFQ16_30455 [Saccharopolyspora rosea]|uniref:LigA protein n=1 Tax=Saccharopolyspora rosea TaxID=524884 RepID=A0ABW3G087_9PSEU
MFGLSDSWLLHDGAVVPSTHVLSHHEQLDRLRRHCPEAVDAALVAGDPCFDRMLASRPLRETYRRRLGARPDQRVVVVSSTWGPESLWGRDPGLVHRLARELPLDEYRVVVALHPNIWYGHTPWQVRMWLAECTRAGVVVVPPEEGWRAALVAADVTVGDHGSVTFYSAALGTPVLLASWPEHTVDPASPIAALLREAPRLADRDLTAQLNTAIADGADRYADIAALTTSVPGESARLLRTAVYTHLDLDEPDGPAEPAAVPLPEVTTPAPTSQLVDVRPDGELAVVTRRSAEALRTPERLPPDAVLTTTTDEPARRLLELAEVLVRFERDPDPLGWIRATLPRLPGCLLGATQDPDGRWIVAGTDIAPVRFTGDPDLGPVYAALLHAWLREGRRDFPPAARLRLGPREATVRVETD